MHIATLHAVNDAGRSTNPIHLDGAARRLGLRGGWVGGPTLLGYLARAASSRWGPAWLAAGGMDVRFRAPVYDQDELRLELTEHASGGAEAWLTNADGVMCASAELTAPGGVRSVDPEPEVRPEPADEDKPYVSIEVLRGLPDLTTVECRPGGSTPDGRVPLEELVGASIDIMYATFRPDGPRILTRLVTTQLAPVPSGSTLVARGRILAAWESRARTYATNSVLLSDTDGEPMLHVANTTIWRMPR
ncbi:hotdog family protein [Microlunatus antarcticus]|uniref:Acyl dehydratase n=1 Tax=Microlunatus antarcticus TaxID=53388 RepID=A0A7W5JZE1_9ACTN|nr:hypothetical protein [Microlunatus antarcticus]MBB3329146.1 acyl dehydratase [Microlunatus antarcticus]